jgi:transposase-like protein
LSTPLVRVNQAGEVQVYVNLPQFIARKCGRSGVMAKRKRRAFTTEFKAQAVRIVRESGKSVGTVARELDLTETALRSWVRQAEVDAGRGPAGVLTTDEREELGRLRREVRTLRMERDILKKATAFFAKENA